MTANQTKILTLLSSGAWRETELEDVYLGSNINSFRHVEDHKVEEYKDALGSLIDERLVSFVDGIVKRL
jgi:hypothetical protein